MKTFSQNSRFTKIMSLTVVSALLINDAIACSLAIHSDDFEIKTDSKFVENLDVEPQEIVDKNGEEAKSFDIDLAEVLASTQAVSGGPGQAEISGSTANTGGGLVNTFTGDLAYSLPLMSVEGFPITLAYDPNIGMDQEASWVGLGWNLSLGSINREMRGIPDDFQGDEVERIVKSKVNTINGKGWALNLFGGFGNPIFSKKTGTDTESGGGAKRSIGLSYSISGGLSFSKGSYLNNYTGEGLTRSLGLQGNVGLNLGLGIDNFGASISPSLGAGIGFSSDSQNGKGVSKNGSFNASGSVGNGRLGLGGDYNASKSVSSNSRTGIKTVNNSSGFSISAKDIDFTAGYSRTRGTMRTYGAQTFIPRFASSNVGSSYYNSDGFNVSGQYFAVHAGAGLGLDNNSSVNRIFQYANLYPAFGYQNHSKGQSNSNAMLDFNRGQSNAANSETTQLAFSVQTYDNFYCSAPGLNASFRPYRYDVTEYHDPTIVSKSTNSGDVTEHNINGGVNILGNYTGGYTITDQNVSGSSSNTTTKAVEGVLHGINPTATFNRKEYYLKTQGETKVVDESLFNAYQGAKASQLDITFGGTSNEIEMEGTLSDKGGNSTALPTQNYSLYRAKNSIHYREYTFEEISAPRIIEEVVCSENAPSVVLRSDYTFATSEKKSHHTGAIEVVDESGMRYVFGIPVYNYLQSEVAFSASTRLDETEFDRTGLLHYENGDNSTSNNLGRAAAYEKTTIPAYVSSYLLTEMLSSDYIDRTGNGVSEDDQGNYYKLNYINPYEGDGNKEDIWKWRMPFCSDLTSAPNGLGFEYEENLAYANRNSYSDKWDDMANYIYGEKEMWFAATVESKNMIAFFCLEDREDQFSAKDENGGLDLTKPGKLLKKIMLFSKNDLELNPSNAKALQIVEFEYDYSLCKKYVGNENTYTGVFDRSGKLTLKRIYTYSGESTEGKAIPIEFDYGSSSTDNPDFEFNSSDRWGNYKPNDINKPNHEFPYADQTNVSQDNIKAWKLKSVSQTGGSKMEFSYDIDKYGFVQNRRAMRMFEVVGMSSTSELQTVSDLTSGSVITESTLSVINGGNHIYFRNPSNKKDHYNVMYFKFETPISSSVSNLPAEVKKQYFQDKGGQIPDEIYFNMFAKLDNRSDVPNEGFEFVESTVKLGKLYNNGNFCGVAGKPDNGFYNYGYVIIEPEDINQFKDEESNKFVNAFHAALLNFLSLLGVNVSYKVNPLQVANWQYARLNAPCNVYGDINYSASVPTEFCDYHLENDGNIFGRNIYRLFNKKGYGMEFNPTKSSMRLFEPDNIKYGGNCRIASITVNDNWDQYSGEDNTSYTYTYDYGERDEISTGVASYEPQVGSNESPFYQFKAYDQKRYLLPDERVYQKDPWGEMAFPGAVVGYSKVISGLFDGDVVGENHEEFYTLYDHPTLVQSTHVQRVKLAGHSAVKDDSYVKEVYGFSQGFYVETSDFHGKPKKSKTIGKNGETISTSDVEYYDFNTETIDYLNREGGIITSVLPQDVDMHADSWKNRNSSFNQTNGNTFSVGVTFIPAGPILIPIPILGYKKSEIFFKYEMEAEAFTFNKIRHRYAVPKAIHTSYLGSYNTARNLYFDEATGDVIVSSLKDEFNDELFSMTYPAHWYYDQCKNMSETDGMLIPNQDISVQSPSSIRLFSLQKLHVGDHLVIKHGTSTVDAWVLEIGDYLDPDFPCGLEVYHLIDGNGAKLSGVDWSTAWFRVERTGVRNATATSMASITTKSFPNQLAPSFTFPTTDILSSSAVKFAENKNVPCVPFDDEQNAQNYPTAQLVSGDVINPFLKGTMGNLRMQSSFAFQQERDESDPNTIRRNAPFVNYEPFYALASCGWQAIDEVDHPNNITAGDYNDWRKLGEVNAFDEFGKPLQSTDQIAVSSAVQYGMNKDIKLVAKAQAVNAKSTEIGFDGFEESEYLQSSTINYVDYGFSLDPGVSLVAQIVSEERHSGNYSLKITDDVFYDFRVEVPTNYESNLVNQEYVVKDCNCLQGFAPQVNKEYFISTWVHENTKTYPFTESGVQVEFFDVNNVSLGSQIFVPQGPVIDGWQKIEGKYTIPSNTSTVRIGLGTTNGSYYDDFRIHPYLAGMTTTVYDQTTLLPIASHDGYNYTTFYNYDENNQLVRVRVETIEGIKTISESERGSFRKQ